MKSYSLFISSPGDVRKEREVAAEVIKRVEAWFGGRIALKPYFWEHEPMLMTRGDFQQQIPETATFDLVICILWSRLGSNLHPERHHRPDGSPYSSGTEYEFETAMRAFRDHGRPDLLVYRRQETPRFPPEPEEEEMRLKAQWKALKRFCEQWLKDSDLGTFKAACVSYEDSGEFERRFEDNLKSMVIERMEKSGEIMAVARPQRWWQGSPYRGLHAFHFEHEKIFFGRTQAIDNVLTSLRKRWIEEKCPFVMIFGASGSGKSSLMRAGVLPWLVKPGVIDGIAMWRRALLRPADNAGDLLSTLAHALVSREALPELLADGTTLPQLSQLLHDEPASIYGLIKGALAQVGQARQQNDKLAHLPTVRLALALDQLEEVFTLQDRFSTEDRRLFFKAIASLVRSGFVWVVATLRSDFYSRCEEVTELVELKKGEGQYHLLQPNATELSQMIRYPAEAAGVVFEETPERGKLDEVIAREANNQPGALPMLGYCLELLYRLGHESGVLTHKQYEDSGRVTGAIEQMAKKVFSNLSEEAKGALDPVLRQLVVLTQEIPTSCVAEEKNLVRAPGARELVKAFVDARLFTADYQEAQKRTVVMLAHESLLHVWDEAINWINENRDFLRKRGRLLNELQTWKNENRHDDYLLRPGLQLNEAKSLLGNHSEVLTPDELEFIDKSRRKEASDALRRSLASGENMTQVSARVRASHPDLRRAIILDVLFQGQPRSRANAAALLGLDPADDLTKELVPVLVKDPADAVREAAAVSLVQVDQESLFAALGRELENGDAPAALRALGYVREAADAEAKPTSFEKLFQAFKLDRRSQIELRSTLLRLRHGWPALFLTTAPAIALSSAFSSFFKLPFGYLNYALCQPDSSAPTAFFGAIVACFFWGGVITFFITLHRVAFRSELRAKSYFQPWPALCFGIMGGVVSSSLVMALLSFVCDSSSSVDLGWTEVDKRLNWGTFFQDILVNRRVFWPYMVLGPGLGLGMAMMCNGIWASPAWSALMAKQAQLSGARALLLIGALAKFMVRFVWPIFLCMAAADVAAYFIVTTSPYALHHPIKPENQTWAYALDGGRLTKQSEVIEWKLSPWGVGLGILCDSLTQTFGAFWCIVGMGIGMIGIRYGVKIEPRRS
jgi:hypothetical protein